MFDFALSDENPWRFRAEWETAKDEDGEEPLETDGDLVGCFRVHVPATLDDDCREAKNFISAGNALTSVERHHSQLTDGNVKVDQTGSHTPELQGRHLDSVRRGSRRENTSCHSVDDFAKEPHDIFTGKDEELDEDGEDGDDTSEEEASSSSKFNS